MLRRRFLSSVLVLSLSTAWAGAALADVAPPDACSASSAVGAACNNAGPNNDEPGTCQSSTCPHSGPGPDGGFVTTENPCMICTESSGGSSCTVGTVGREGAITGTMMLLGLAALLADRRSRGSTRSRRSRRS